jgi:tetratricopeptide (TPR) repeat protein
MHGKLPADDDEALDELFDRAVESLSQGLAIDLDTLLGDRPMLRPQAEQVLALARQVSAGSAVAAAVLPRLEGFTLLEEVGRGGMGIVYRARQDRLDREVAVKVLSPALLASPRARERFALEAKALARLRHPHVVVVHEIVARDDLCAYAMEWIAGTTLARAIADRDPRLPPVAIARLGIALAEALTAVHAAGLVHRDVKPSNVLLRADGTPVLTDFSLVHDDAQTMHTRTGEFLGTLAYAAPEQLRGERDRIGPRTDVYGLGVTLWSALAGKPPFGSGSTATMLQRIEHGQLPPLRRVAPAVPRDLATIVHTAMERDPARRYADAAALAADLRRLLAFEPIHARPAGIVLRTQRWLERSPQLAFALAGLFVAVVLGLAAAVWLSLDLAQQRDTAQAAESRARDETTSQQELVAFLKGLIRAGDATLHDGRADITVREAVERAAATTDLGRHRPAVQAAVRLAIGELLAATGLIERAEPHVEQALTLLRQQHGPDSAEVAEAVQQMSRVYRSSGRSDLAAPLLQEVVRIRRALAPTSDLAALYLAQSLNSLGIALRQQQDYAEAEQALRESLAIYRRVLKCDEENVAMVLTTLSTLLVETGRAAEALPLGEHAVATIRAFHRDRAHADVPHAEFSLASVRWHLGERTAGLAAMFEAREACRTMNGDRHATTARMTTVLGRCLRDGGDLPAAAQELTAAAATYRELGNAFEHASCTLELADVLARDGQGAAAAAAFTPLLDAPMAHVRVRALCLASQCARKAGDFAAARWHLTVAWHAATALRDRRLVATTMVDLHTVWANATGAPAGELARWQHESETLAAKEAK